MLSLKFNKNLKHQIHQILKKQINKKYQMIYKISLDNLINIIMNHNQSFQKLI